MTNASLKRERVLSRDKLFIKGGSKDGETLEMYRSSVDKLAKKLDNSINKSQLTEMSITRNTSAKIIGFEPKTDSRAEQVIKSRSKTRIDGAINPDHCGKDSKDDALIQSPEASMQPAVSQQTSDPICLEIVKEPEAGLEKAKEAHKLTHKDLKILTKETFNPKKHPATPTALTGLSKKESSKDVVLLKKDPKNNTAGNRVGSGHKKNFSLSSKELS